MIQCPQCHASITAEVQPTHCPDCQAPLSPGNKTLALGNATIDIPAPSDPPAKPGTIADYGQATIDLPAEPKKPGTVSGLSSPTIDLPGQSSHADEQGFDVQPGPSGSTYNEKREPAGTLDSEDFTPPVPKGGTVAVRRVQATVDHQSSHDLDVEQRLQLLWGESSAQSRPQMTIRGARESAEAASPNSTLVIRERALRARKGSDDATPGILGTPSVGADYDLLEVLGEGGMGVVYTARQASIDREVAVKMLKPDKVRNEAQRKKFLSEAAVTGELDHPNIVPIYDLGQSSDGALFYSMKKVQGTPWSEIIGRTSLPENLSILMKVADAVAFAHARGVIHRDLKPENTMLGEFGEVLVLDWGLAIATEGHRETPNVPSAAQGVAGTPSYMAPEMATGPMEKIGKASDIYLLGAILYEVVTGRPPHAGDSAMVCLLAAARNEIVPTEKRGELIDIARKAMAFEPADRYPSVQAFQAAVREYQSHSESIALSERAESELRKATQSDEYSDFARAVFAFEEAYGLWDGNLTAKAGISRAKLHYAGSAHRKHDYDLGLSLLDPQDPAHQELHHRLVASKQERDARQQRLRQARRIMVGLAAIIFVSVSIGIVLVTLLKFEADRQAEIAKQNAEEADRQAKIAKANETEAARQATIAQANATEAIKQTGIAKQNEQLAIAAQKDADARRREAEYEAYVALIGLAAAKIQENALSQAFAALDACAPELRGWEWNRLRYVVDQGRGKDFDVQERIDCLALSADDRLVATGSRDGRVRVWDVRQEKVTHELPLKGANAYVTALALAPTARLVAVGSNVAGAHLQLWDLETGEVRGLNDAAGHTAAVLHATFSRDGSKLLTASRDGTAKLWDVATGQPLVTYLGHSRMVWQAVFSPDESHIATASEDGTVRLWKTETGQELLSPRYSQRIPFTGHRGPVYAVAFLPSDPSESTSLVPGVSYVASAGYDKRILLWKPADLVPFDFRKLLADEPVAATPAIELVGHTAAVRDLALSPDGSRLLSASSDHTLRTWYANEEDVGYAIIKRGTLDKELRGHDGPVQAARFWHASGDKLVSAGYDGKVRFWSIGSYHEEQPIPGLVLRGHLDAVMTARFSHDGKSIVTASPDRTAKKWSVAEAAEQITFREGHAYLTSKATFFSDQTRLLTAAVDGTVRVWNVDKGAEILKLSGTGYRSAAALSADDRWILTGSDQAVPVTRESGQTIQGQAAILWDAETGKQVHTLAGHKVPVTVVAFSPNSELAFSGDDNGVGNLWQRSTGQHLARLEYHAGSLSAALFSPDGQTLLTASTDKTVCQWDLTDLANITPQIEKPLRHPAAVTTMALAPDGEKLLTGCEDGVLRLWNRTSGELVWVGQPITLNDERSLNESQMGDINAVAISPDGTLALAVDSVQHIVRLFDLETGRELLGTSLEGEVDHFLRLRRRDAIAWSAAFSPDGKRVVTVGGDEARLWDLQGTELANFGPHRPVIYADFSPDDKFVISSGWDQTARIWQADDGGPVLTLSARTAGELQGHSAAVNSAVYSPDGKHVLTAAEDGTVRLWDLATMKVVRVYRGHAGGVTRALFVANSQRFVTASRDGTAALWSLDQTDGPLKQFTGHAGAVLDVAISGDEKYLLTGSADNSARVWDLESGEMLVSLEGHTGEVTAVAFYNGEKPRALTGSTDQTAKLWDLATPLAAPEGTKRTAKELLTLRGHTRGLTSVAFAPNGRAALTASRDGVAILWPTLD